MATSSPELGHSASNVRRAETDFEKWINNSKQVIPFLFFNCPFDFDERPCLGTKRSGEFEYINYRQLKDNVANFASALIDNHFSVADKLVIIAENREEWITADLGTMLVVFLVSSTLFRFSQPI